MQDVLNNDNQQKCNWNKQSAQIISETEIQNAQWTADNWHINVQNQKQQLELKNKEFTHITYLRCSLPPHTWIYFDFFNAIWPRKIYMRTEFKQNKWSNICILLYRKMCRYMQQSSTTGKSGHFYSHFFWIMKWIYFVGFWNFSIRFGLHSITLEYKRNFDNFSGQIIRHIDRSFRMLRLFVTNNWYHSLVKPIQTNPNLFEYFSSSLSSSLSFSLSFSFPSFPFPK